MIPLADFPPVPLTLEGSFVLHQFFRFNWAKWRSHAEGPFADAERKKIADEFASILHKLERTGAEGPVQTALFSQLGHKGDLILVHFRESLEALNQVELDLAQTALFDFLELKHSYVSVVELGLYESTRKTYEAAAAKGFAVHSPEWDAEIAESLQRGAEAMKPRSVALRAGGEIPVLLSHGSQARRAGELVHRSFCREAADDALAWADRTAVWRTREANHLRVHWDGRLGMGRRSFRR